MHKLRDDLQNEMAIDVDDSGFYENMAPPDVESAPPHMSSPDKFLKRRSVISEFGSSDLAATPRALELQHLESFEIPADLDESQKIELAGMLLQIQQLELTQFSCIISCSSLGIPI